MTLDAASLPRLIQGGMGVGISSWQLANTVASNGGLGVVSGVGLGGTVARRLMQGDPGGHLREALAHFPDQQLAEKFIKKFYRADAETNPRPFRPVGRLDHHQKREIVQAMVCGSFVEVWLAKRGHDGPIGINLLEKVQIATPSTVLGAMMAGVDVVLAGAGIPSEIPQLLNDLAAGQKAGITLDVEGETKSEHRLEIDPATILNVPVGELNRPTFLAIVSTHVLAMYLLREERTRPDGFVYEGYDAGGHNAPPRSKEQPPPDQDPVYSEKDNVDVARAAKLGSPFWLAGGVGTPEGLEYAMSVGARGVQVGSPFALSTESGLRPDLRDELIKRLGDGTLHVRTDGQASPTGFPFKVAELPGTIGDRSTYAKRERICDLAYLRRAYVKPDGTLGDRCASEPIDEYLKHGGELEETVNRACICNGLMATNGIAQDRPDGPELPIVTLGSDLRPIKRLYDIHQGAWSAVDVINWIMAPVMAEQKI